MKTVKGTATFQATVSLPIPGGAFGEKETLEHMFNTCEREAVAVLATLLQSRGGSIIGKPTVKIHLVESGE